MQGTTITICIVANQATHMNNLRLLFNDEPGMEVTGYYENAEEALRKTKWQHTEILLTELDLPGMPGVELIRHVRRRNPHTRIMVYTSHEDRATVLEAVCAGASGYILKGCRLAQLIEAMRELYNGAIPMSPPVARILVREFQVGHQPMPLRAKPKAAQGRNMAALAHLPSILSAREHEILKFLNQGLTYKQIANRLFIVTSTVCSHVKNLYAKLQAHNKQEALRKGRNLQLI